MMSFHINSMLKPGLVVAGKHGAGVGSCLKMGICAQSVLVNSSQGFSMRL